ncbi:carboxypeptidase-like regulatory domain-containing protein [Melioribacteraceae bacterium 4301-Me]|uniref:carboxypeptidase-like regulatory domain-containing protein n=1 Tax=Pyranulibacter aquaticus TaxID=3163344 RepID=UPI0035962ECD
MRKILLFAFLSFFIALQIRAQTGKIVGTVKDAATGEPLIGTNVIIEGTTTGAATNADGFYVILNVPAGTYTLRFSMVGYTTYTVRDVVVNINQTTTINAELSTETIQTNEIVVTATTPIVQKDVSSSRINLDVKQISSLPVTSITGVIGLQAGVEPGLVIRGGAANQTGFVVNGMTLRDERDNSPFTGISYTAIDQIQIQTGGFNAEYGDVRSGLINVTTKEGSKDKYYFSFLGRYSAPSAKHFGPSPNDPNTYWLRPYLDPAVCWTGTTNGAWDEYTQKQYPSFEGWIAIANKTLQDNDPKNDLTPLAAQKLFLWQHRRQLDIRLPDYDMDMSFGGPVPVIGKDLGNLRFFASYRQTQNEYVIPLSRNGLNQYSGQIKITSDVGKGKKLMVQGLLAQDLGTNNNNAGLNGLFTSPDGIASVMNQVSYIDARMFAPDYWAPSTVNYFMYGAKFTNVINPSTLYEITFTAFGSIYKTGPGRSRNTDSVYQFGNNYFVDEAPFGYSDFPTSGIGSGLRMGVGFSNSRDSSRVTTYNLRGDFQSQINEHNEIKAGIEFTFTDNNVHYGSIDEYLPSGRSRSIWHTYPKRGAIYIQDKLEFEGMIANLGLRAEYSDPGGTWYDFSSPYTHALSSTGTLDTVAQSPVVKQFTISPRLGIAFPITENSKLYFNYGHFRQIPTPDNLYLVRRFLDNNAVTRLANPNQPLQKTVAYELGYEQNLLDMFLIHLAGYYKDVSLQSRLVTFVSRDGKVNYSVTRPDNYQDVRGFEVTVTKNRGSWIQGFVNYTYDVTTAGNFGFDTYYENPAEQKRYELTTTSYYQERPVPRPYARMSVDIFTPPDFGPKLGGIDILGNWRLNIVGSWRSGYYFSWANGGSIPGVVNNVQWNDYWNFDLRLSKSFRFGIVDLELFADVNNVFNYKYMSQGGFVDANDYLAYMRSLHLPKSAFDNYPRNPDGSVNIGYSNTTDPSYYEFGNDRPGDYRTGPYHPWDPNADPATKEQWLKNKSYIDMPNQTFLTFLNPRDIFWGLKVTLEL